MAMLLDLLLASSACVGLAYDFSITYDLLQGRHQRD